VKAKPKVESSVRTSSSTPAISPGSCSGVQKMWLSSCVKPRTRSMPCRTPERS
jgi:hypothetical protein